MFDNDFMLWPAHENKTARYQLNTVVTQEMPIVISYPGLVQMLPDNKKISTFIL